MDPSVASSRMNQYEKGKHHPDPMTIGRLCDVLKVPAAYMYCADDRLAELVVTFSSLREKDQEKMLENMNRLLSSYDANNQC